MIEKDIILENKNIIEQNTGAKTCILLGDSLKIMKGIRDNSVDLIFADPPYNIGKDFGNNKDKWSNPMDYIEWCKQWINECMRILKDDGTMYFMTATQFMPYLDVFAIENYNVLSRIIWSYDSSGVQSKKIFGSLYERIYDHHKTQKKKTVCKQAPRKVASCDGLQKSLSNLYGTIDKILQAKITMRKLAKLPELAEHFTTLSKADNETIDEAIGGIKVNILNNPKPDIEFIYNVVCTDGQTLKTNDKTEFMAFMAKVA